MAIALRHPITAKVDDRASFLRCLLKEYPAFLKDWEENLENEFAQIAHKNADGDKETESSIYASLCSTFEDCTEKKNMFYQSVLIMCFSYYESCVALLSKETKSEQTIASICQSRGIQLSEDSLKKCEYLKSDIKKLRNNICHNNFGTYRQENVLKRLATQYTGFDFDNKMIYITDSHFVIDTLNKMHQVLHELCEKLGYKTILFNGDSK